MNCILVCLLLLAALTVPAPVLAVDGHDHAGHSHGGKPFYGHVHVATHLDGVTGSDAPKSGYSEVYTHSHAHVGGRLGGGFSLNAGVKIEGEPAGHNHGGGGAHEENDHEDEDHAEEAAHLHGDAPDGSNNIYEDHPLAVEQLTLNYDTARFSAYAGKFNPVVGFDYHRFPGVYGYQAIEGYALREKIGFGGAAKHNAEDFGTHRLDISTFFADTTFLSDSLLHQRGHTRREDGGISNTEDFSSFAVSLGGSDFYSLRNNIVEGISYRVGYAKQAAGIGNDEDENRASVSLGYKQQFTRELSGELLAEHVDIRHLDGEADHNRAYSTAALRLNWRQWNAGTSYTAVYNDASDSPENADGGTFQLSAGYRFENGICIDAGWQHTDEEGATNNRFGMLISYGFEF